MTSSLFAHLGTHVILSLCALAAAVAIGVPVAALAVGRPLARMLSLGTAGALRVIPSVAILTLTLPYLGLGFRPALLALIVLALPPIVVNTDLGLRAVPAAIREAAVGVGMTARQIRRRVEWPLAVPLAVAGVRTAAVDPDGLLWISLAVPYTYVYDNRGDKRRTIQFRGAGPISPTHIFFTTDKRILVTPGCYAFARLP